MTLLDDDISTLDAQASLADIRLRVLNRERVPPDEMRLLLANLTRSRDNAARAAKSATAAKSRENRKAARPQVSLSDLFGPKG